jgi:hypothetical protein
VQVDADVKVLSEFLSYLQADTVRVSPAISSLSPAQAQSQGSRMYDKHPLVLHPDTVIRLRDQTSQYKSSAATPFGK